jgi:hypothetical protein
MADIVNQILLNVDAGDASTKIGDIKRAIKELEGVALASGDSNSDAFKKATQAAGQLRDRLEDVKDATKSFKGDPLEGLSKGLGSLKGRLSDLDFQGFNDEVGRLKTLSKQVSFKELSSSVGETGKSFLSLGKILLTNPIFLIASIITTIVTNFDKLASAGGKIGLVFSAIGDTINFVIDKLKMLSDFLGLTDFQGQEKANNTLENANKEQKAIEARYDSEIKIAQAAGKDVTDLELKKQEEIRANVQLQIDQLNYLAQSQGQLTKEQQDELNSLNQQYQDSLTETGVITAQAQKKASDEAQAAADKAREKAEAAAEKAREKRKADREKRLEDEKSLANEILVIQEEQYQDSLDQFDKEARQIDLKYEKLIAEAKRLGKDTSEIVKLYNNEISELNTKQADFELKQEQDKNAKILEERAKTAEGSVQKGIQEQTLAITETTNDELAALNEQYRTGQIKSEEEYQSKKSEIIEKEEDARRQIELDAAQKRLTNIENESKEALALLPEGSQEYKDTKAEYDAQRIAQEQIVADKLREINQDLTDDQIAAELKLLEEREKARLGAIKISQDTFSAISANIAQTSQGFENLGSDILQAASNIGGAVTTAVNTFTDKNADGFQKAIAGFQAASAAIGEISNVLSAQADRRLEEIEKTKEAEIEASESTKEKQLIDLQEELDAGVITKEEFDKRKTKIEQDTALAQFKINEDARKAEYNAKKKTFEQEKKLRIGQAIASGAQAAINAFASGLAVPIIGPATGAAYAAIAAAFTAAQVGLIASQKFEAFQAGTPPSFSSPSVSTGGGGVGGGEGNNTFSPPQFFGLGQGIFQNQAAGQQTQQVVVLESDITRVQDRVRVIEDRSVIG